jgi:hypothetical protein
MAHFGMLPALIPAQGFWARWFPAGETGFQKTLGVAATVVLCVGAFFLLRMMQPRQRRSMLVVLCALAGLFYPVEFFIPRNNFLTPARIQSATFFTILGAFAVGVAMVNLFIIHGKNIQKLKNGWYNSAALFFGLLAMTLFGIWHEYATPEQIPVHWGYDLCFYGLLVPLKATMFSLLAFYIVTAAYRAFKLKSGEATIMMVVALVVMAGQVPLGTELTNKLPDVSRSWVGFFRLENLNTWLQSWPGMAVARAIVFGAGIGSLAISLRLWLSLERGTYFEQEF